jgi:hypothetical protein
VADTPKQPVWALATARGHYPGPDGVIRVVPAGTRFQLIEGKSTKASWFKVLPPEKKAGKGDELA